MSNPSPEKADSGAAAPPPASGGIKAMLPLILTVVLMPALAYTMTMFVLLPKLQKSLGGDTVHARESEDGDKAHGGGGAHGTPDAHGASTSSGGGKSGGKTKVKVPLTKLIVNVSGSLGSRMLLVSLTLAGNNGDLKSRIEDENDQLRDVASSILASKTLADLEKPEARNLLRAELLSQFNTVLGAGTVQELYITEFAIQ